MENIKIGKLIWYTILFATATAALYFLNFNPTNSVISKETSDWGGFADYIGGLINPVVAILILYYVAKSYEIQRAEIQELKTSMSNQVKIAAYSQLIHIELAEQKMLDELSQYFYDEADQLRNERNRLARSKKEGDIERVQSLTEEIADAEKEASQAVDQVGDRIDLIKDYGSQVQEILSQTAKDK